MKNKNNTKTINWIKLILSFAILGFNFANGQVVGIYSTSQPLVIVGQSISLDTYITSSNTTNTGLTYSVNPLNLGYASSIYNSGNFEKGMFFSSALGVVTITTSSISNPTVTSFVVVSVVSNISVDYIYSSFWSQQVNTISFGESVSMWAYTYPRYASDTTLTWEVSDNTLGTLSTLGTNLNGIRTFISNSIPGIVTITARSVSNTAITASYVFTIVSEIKLISLAIFGESHRAFGESTSIRCNFLPVNPTDKSLIWEISDPNLGTIVPNAQLNNAIFTANSIAGVVNITAKSVANHSILGVHTIQISNDCININNYSPLMNLGDIQVFTITACMNKFPRANYLNFTLNPANSGYIQEGTFYQFSFTPTVTGVVTITVQSIGSPSGSVNVVVTVGGTVQVENVNIYNYPYYQNRILAFNEQEYLFAETLPFYASDSTVTWELSDSNLGKIVNTENNFGKRVYFVVGTISGIVTVTARSVSNPTIFDIKVFTITGNIPLNNIYFNCHSSLLVNSSFALCLNYNPSNTTDSKSIIWSVEPSNMGYVDTNYNFIAGSITGIVTITATSVANPTINASQIIEILPYQTPPIYDFLHSVISETQNVTIDGSTISITMMTITGAVSYCFKYSTDPLFETNVTTVCGLETPSYSFSFWFQNGRMEANNIYWQVGAVDANGNVYWSSTQRKEVATNISASNNLPKLEIIPNPSSDFIEIKGLVNNAKVEMYDITGGLVLSSFSKNIAVENLKSGMYFVRIDTQVLKFVKL